MCTDVFPQIAINWDERPQPTLILRGDLNIYQADRLYEAALTLSQHQGDIVVSCQAVGQVDTAVLQILLVLKRDFQCRGDTLRLEGVSDELRELLELAGVADTLVGQGTTEREE